MKNISARRFVSTSLALALVIALSGFTDASASTRGHFDDPVAVTVCAGRVWVANGNNSLTEVNEASGAVVRVLGSGSYDFNNPVALGCSDDRLWVVDKGTALGQNAGVTEINATSGRLIRTLSSAGYEFDQPNAIAVGRSHVWVTNGATQQQPPTPDGDTGNSVTEIGAANGSVVRVISGPKYRINYAFSVVILGGHVWVESAGGLTEINASNGSSAHFFKGTDKVETSPNALTVAGSHLWGANESTVVEISTANGATLRTVAGANPHSGIGAIASNRADVWIANYDNSVSEINATTGQRVRVIRGPANELDQPGGIALSARDVWVTNEANNELVEFNATTGSLVRVIK
jgi:hypothetical protein